MAARLFLFHGTDSRASHRAVQRWQTLFAKKYGDATRYIFDADELPIAELSKQLAGVLEVQTLFATPKLILIKRLSSQDKSKIGTVSKQIISLIGERRAAIDDQVTVAFWEDNQLPANHAVLTSFEKWEQSGVGKITLFTIPSERSLPALITAYVEKEGGSIAPEAIRLLVTSFTHMGVQQRMAKKLRSTDTLREDERSWWLYQILDGALLLADGVITPETIEKVGGMIPEPVNIFNLTDSIVQQQWKTSSRLLGQLTETADDADYYGLYAALRWKITSGKLSREQQQYYQQLLASLELVVKNFPVAHSWLMALVISKVPSAQLGTIVNARKLWLAHLQRT